MQTLAKATFSRIMRSKTPNPNRVVPENVVIDVINAMVDERTARAAAANPLSKFISDLPMQHPQPMTQGPPQITTTTTTTETATEEEEEEGQAPPPPPPPPHKETEEEPSAAARDAGVSDAVWAQLQLSKAAAAAEQRALASARQLAERQVREQEEALKRERDESARREVLRKLEEARERQRKAEKEREERERREAEVQKKLRSLGVCVQGFQWLRQADGGYRCRGGSHYVSSTQLGM